MDRETNRTILDFFLYHKWSILTIVTLSLVLTSIYLYYTPNIYKAYTIIEVKDDNNHISGSDILLSVLTGYTSSSVNKDIEILKTFEINRHVLDKIDFNLNNEYIDKRDIFDKIISKNLHISKVSKNTSLIKIEFLDVNSKRATDYVNTLAQTFISQNINNKSEQNSRVINFINRELNRTKYGLKKAEQKLENYQELHKVINPSVQSSSVIKKIGDIELKLANNQLKKELINTIADFIASNRDISSIAPLLKSLKERPTLNLISKLEDNQIKLKELSIEYTYRHPKVIETIKKIRALKNKIKSNIKNLQWSINQENRTLKVTKLKYEKELKSFPEKEKYIINMKRDYEVNSKIYKYLFEKKSENEIIKVAIVSDYRIVESAYTPKKPVSPKKVSFILVSIITSFLFAIFTLLSINKFNKEIKTVFDIKNINKIKLYGIIPNFRKNKKEFMESCKKISSKLQLLPHNSNYSKVILISSMTDNQGKTTLVTTLGDIFKDMHDKTIIIDFNIKKANIDKIFKLNNDIGLGTYLSGGHKIYEIIQKTANKNLDIITLGKTPSNASKLIFSDRFPILLKELQKEYNNIIIDTASIEVSYETLHLMRYADINLLIFRMGVSKKESLKDLNSLVQEHNIKHIGIVLNQFQ